MLTVNLPQRVYGLQIKLPDIDQGFQKYSECYINVLNVSCPLLREKCDVSFLLFGMKLVKRFFKSRPYSSDTPDT